MLRASMKYLRQGVLVFWYVVLDVVPSKYIDHANTIPSQNTPQGLMLTYQYINETAPFPVPLTMWFGHNYLKFDSDAWPYLA